MLNAELSGAYLFAGIIFSGIGVAAFLYGSKQKSFTKMIFGALLIAYPFFVSTTWMAYAIGILLTVGLFLFKD
jgi:hypothetical protein